MRLHNVESRVFGALVLATTAFFWMVRGFLLPVFWAAVFAVLATDRERVHAGAATGKR